MQRKKEYSGKTMIEWKCIAKALTTSVFVVTALSACSARDAEPVPTHIALLTDQWETACLSHDLLQADENGETGYFRETLLIETSVATQTINYFQDADCSIPVTPNQVSSEDETFFLQSQTTTLAVNYPDGTTATTLGVANYIDLSQIAVAIDNATLTEQQLTDRQIELQELLGIFVITESDRLHLAATNDGSRADTLPLSFFYTRKP